MNHQTLKELARVDGPAVSILCPLEVRRPGNEHDSLLLRELRDQAAKELEASLPGPDAALLIARVDDALGSVNLQQPGEGVAILVSPTVTRVMLLDASVEPKVATGDRFAVRELISACARSPRARIIVLSRAKSRCIDLSDAETVERLDSGFPVDVEPPTEADAPHRNYPLDEHAHAEAAKFVFRAVDHALATLEHADPRPVVLVGEERDLAYFDEVTRQRDHLIGRVHGNHQRDTPDAVARLVRPVLDDYYRRQEIDASDEVREAIGSRAVCGIADTWLAALAGRGHRLVVEDDYRFSARVVDGALEAAPGDNDAFDAVARTVEEVIRRDGDVVAVPAGSLEDLEHIALLIRF